MQIAFILRVCILFWLFSMSIIFSSVFFFKFLHNTHRFRQSGRQWSNTHVDNAAMMVEQTNENYLVDFSQYEITIDNRPIITKSRKMYGFSFDFLIWFEIYINRILHLQVSNFGSYFVGIRFGRFNLLRRYYWVISIFIFSCIRH